jgi:hypothetical protein
LSEARSLMKDVIRGSTSKKGTMVVLVVGMDVEGKTILTSNITEPVIVIVTFDLSSDLSKSLFRDR